MGDKFEWCICRYNVVNNVPVMCSVVWLRDTYTRWYDASNVAHTLNENQLQQEEREYHYTITKRVIVPTPVIV